jgi:hypothetical protein
LEVFYELEREANRQLDVIAVLANKQLKEPASRKIFQRKNLVINDAQFQRHNFNNIGLRRVFGSGSKLPLIGE